MQDTEREATIEREDDAPTVASDGEIERQAERLVELESELRDAAEPVEDAETAAALDLRFNLHSDPGARSVSVEQIEKTSYRGSTRVELEVDIDGERIRYDFPWPDNPNNPSEPLTRVCRYQGVQPDRIADLDEVPVVRSSDGEWKLVVPPTKSEKEIDITLPNGRHINPRIPPLLSMYKSSVSIPIALLLCKLSHFEPASSRNDTIFPLTTAVVTALATYFGIIAVVMVSLPLHSTIGALVGSIIAVPVIQGVLGKADQFGDAELYDPITR